MHQLKRELLLLAALSLALVALGVVHLVAGRVMVGLASLFGAICFSGVAFAFWTTWQRNRSADDEEPNNESPPGAAGR